MDSTDFVEEITSYSSSNEEEAMMNSDSNVEDDTSDAEEETTSSSNNDDEEMISDCDEDMSDNEETSQNFDAESDSSSGNGDTMMVLPFTNSSFMATYRHQSFSLPDSIMHYISKNPSSAQVYQKLAMSCKYFFIKNPIIIISTLDLDMEENDTCKFEWYTLCDEKSLDLNNIGSKVWVTDELTVAGGYNETEEGQECLPFIFTPNIYRSDAKKCSFEYADILLKDLIFLAANAEKVKFDTDVQVMDDNGSVVALEKIVAALPNLNKFNYYLRGLDSSKIVTLNTAQELIKIQHFPNLVKFKLEGVPESFDIDSFFRYIKQNKKTKFYLDFDSAISEEYENRLNAVVAEILAYENREYKMPFLDFSAIDADSDDKMRNLYFS